MAPRSAQSRWLVAAFGALVLSGCSAVPEKLIAEAQEAAENAKSARAELYAPELAAKAQDALSAAEAEIAVQDEKFVVLRNYKDAALKLTEAVAAFGQATTEATNQKAQLKAPVRTLVRDAALMVDAVEQEVAKLTARRPDEEVLPLQDQVAAMRQGLTEATAAEKAGDFKAAKVTLEGVLAAATSLRTTLDPNWVMELPPAPAAPPAATQAAPPADAAGTATPTAPADTAKTTG